MDEVLGQLLILAIMCLLVSDCSSKHDFLSKTETEKSKFLAPCRK